MHNCETEGKCYMEFERRGAFVSASFSPCFVKQTLQRLYLHHSSSLPISSQLEFALDFDWTIHLKYSVVYQAFPCVYCLFPAGRRTSSPVSSPKTCGGFSAMITLSLLKKSLSRAKYILYRGSHRSVDDHSLKIHQAKKCLCRGKNYENIKLMVDHK